MILTVFPTHVNARLKSLLARLWGRDRHSTGKEQSGPRHSGLTCASCSRGFFVCQALRFLGTLRKDVYVCTHVRIWRNPAYLLGDSTSPIFYIVSNRVVLRSLGGSLIFLILILCVRMHMHACIEKGRKSKNFWSCLLSAVQAGQKLRALLCVCPHSWFAMQISIFFFFNFFVGMGGLREGLM